MSPSNSPEFASVQSSTLSIPTPLAWPTLKVTGVHEEYFDALPYDGSATYGVTATVAKSEDLRESAAGVSFGAVDDIILAAPLRTVVRNDADDDDVECQLVQISNAGGVPPGSGRYKVLTLDANDAPVWDYVRAHA